MNILHRCVYIVLPLIFLQIEIGHAIECYVCKSEDHPSCESSTPDIEYLKNCSSLKTGPKYVACRKIDQWVDFEVLSQKPTKRIVRQCAADIDIERLCYYRAGFGGRMNVCDCRENKCNSAPSTFSSVITTVICLFLVVQKVL